MKGKKIIYDYGKKLFSRFLLASSTLNKVSAKKTEKYQGQVEENEKKQHFPVIKQIKQSRKIQPSSNLWS